MLFKSPGQTFNPQIHTEELSLTSQMDKDFAVHNKVLSRYERYAKFTSFLFHTGRVNGGARAGWIKTPSADSVVHDNAYRVKFRSINIKPAISMGSARFGEWYNTNVAKPDMSGVVGVTYSAGFNAGNIVTDVLCSIAIKHEPANNIFGEKFNPGDTIELNGGLGAEIWIQRVRPASTGDHMVLDGKVINKTATDFDPTALAEDTVLMEGGNRFGEGSLRGYQRYHANYWKIYYSFISRYTLSFTGNALDQKRVVWTDKTVDGANNPMNGSKGALWQYEEEWFADEMFGIFLELACRFASSSMDPSTHSWFENSGRNLLTMTNMAPELGMVPPRTPDGWIRQFKDTIDMSYDVNDGLPPALLEAICNILSSNSPKGSQGNTFIIIGDDVAYNAWDTGMKKIMGWNIQPGGAALPAAHNTNIVMDVNSGQKVKLGFTIESYTYKNNEFIFMTDELFSHPGLNNRNGGLVGSGNMYFINVSTIEGVSNFELFTRGKGRFYKKKYVNGMHSLNAEQDNSMYASTGFDGAFCHYLAELFPIVYFEDTCAVLRGTGTYDGGALSGNSALGNFPTIM